MPSDVIVPEYDGLVNVLPTNSLKTVLDFVRGNNPGTHALALAAINVASYAASQFVPEGKEPIFGYQNTAPVGRAEAEQAILAALPDDDGTMKAGVGAATWLIILRVVVPIIVNLLK